MTAGQHAISRVRPRVTTRAIVLAAVVTGLLITAVFPLRTYLAERAQVGALESRITELQRDNRRLAARIDRLQDPKYLERLARECLGMVKPGEISFVVVPRGHAPAPRAC